VTCAAKLVKSDFLFSLGLLRRSQVVSEGRVFYSVHRSRQELFFVTLAQARRRIGGGQEAMSSVFTSRSSVRSGEARSSIGSGAVKCDPSISFGTLRSSGNPNVSISPEAAWRPRRCREDRVQRAPRDRERCRSHRARRGQ